MSRLPDDVIKHIFAYLETSDAFVVAQTNKYVSNLILRECPWLWRICRIPVTEGVWWQAGAHTRAKRKLTHVHVPRTLATKGNYLHNFTLGHQNDSCNIELQNQHFVDIANACPLLQKLKLYVTDSSPDLRMSALNYLLLRCADLTSVALPINAAAVIMDQEPVAYNSITKVRLHGALLWVPTLAPQSWLMASIVAVQFVDVEDLNHMHLLECCVNLKHLIIHNCTSAESHPLHVGADSDATGRWMYELAKQLQTLAVVQSPTVMCICFLLSSLTIHDKLNNAPWSDLHTLWLDRDVTTHAYDLVPFFSCIHCSSYIVYKRSCATELQRCAECRQRCFQKLETVYLC